MEQFFVDREMESSGSSGDCLSELSVSETDTEFVIEEFSRSNKKAATKKRFLDGTSCKPYHVSSELSRSFGDGDNSSTLGEPCEWNERVCNNCTPVLQKYAATFASLKQQDTELKKCETINLHPKRPDTEQY